MKMTMSRRLFASFSTLVMVVSELAILADGQEITGFTLVDASSSNTDLGAIGDGSVWDIAGHPALSIRVAVNDPTKIVGSVQVRLNGRIKNNDNAAPYSLSGEDDATGNFVPEGDLQFLGGHSVTAALFSGPDATGDQLHQFSVPFLLESSNPSQPLPPTPAPVAVEYTTPQPSTASPTLNPTAFPTAEALPTTAYPTQNYAALAEDTDVPAFPHSSDGVLSGVLEPFRKLTLCFDGPETNEQDRRPVHNPFADFRMECTFRADTAFSVFRVPGYFAADGNAANTGAEFGNVWCCHASVDLDGLWTWDVAFEQGRNVALFDAENNDPPPAAVRRASAGYFDGMKGNFTIVQAAVPTMNAASGSAGGRLSYVGEHHLLYSHDGLFALQVGAHPPQSLLAAASSSILDDWSTAHGSDFNAQQDPTWAGGQGQGVIGALNYMAQVGINTIVLETLHIDNPGLAIAGKDNSVFPYVRATPGDARTRMDVSKLAQWQVILDHASDLGLSVQLKTNGDFWKISSDDGVGDERRMYYRELQARFGHILSLTYNLGDKFEQSPAALATYVDVLDPYNHPIVVQAETTQQVTLLEPLLGLKSISGASIVADPTSVYNNTRQWIEKSADAEDKWVVTCDQTSTSVPVDEVDGQHNQARMHVLWGNLMAVGGGVTFHWEDSNGNSDGVAPHNLRDRQRLWKQAHHAYHFFMDNSIPFHQMSPLGGDRCPAESRCLGNNDFVVVQVLDWSGSVALTLPTQGNEFTEYAVKWFNPRNGGALMDGTVLDLMSDDETLQSIGEPPQADGKDWIALITRSVGTAPPEEDVEMPTAAPVGMVSTQSPSASLNWEDSPSAIHSPPDDVLPNEPGKQLQNPEDVFGDGGMGGVFPDDDNEISSDAPIRRHPSFVVMSFSFSMVYGAFHAAG